MKGLGSFLALALCTITTQCLVLELEDLATEATVYISPFGYYVRISNGNEAVPSVCNAYCELNYGGTLGSLYNSIENDNLLSLFLADFQDVPDTSVGIGIQYDQSSYKWMDGIPLDYQNWDSGEPNVNNGECAVMDLAGYWKTASCEEGIRQFYCNRFTRVFSENFVVAYSPSRAENASNAEDYCSDLYGTTLGIVRSADEQTELEDSISILNVSTEATVHIGLMGDGPGGEVYVWANGKTPEDYDYSNWDPNEDLDIDNDLCVVNTVEGWRSAPCDSGTFTLSCVLWVPTSSPTAAPVPAPTPSPSRAPSPRPTLAPTDTPPTLAPTAAPPTLAPTTPTAEPTPHPTATPIIAPTAAPVLAPTPQPVSMEESTTEAPKSDDSEGLQWYFILIIVLAALALLALVLFFLYKQRQNKEERYEVQTTQAIAMQTTTTTTTATATTNTTAATGYSAQSSGEKTY